MAKKSGGGMKSRLGGQFAPGGGRIAANPDRIKHAQKVLGQKVAGITKGDSVGASRISPSFASRGSTAKRQLSHVSQSPKARAERLERAKEVLGQAKTQKAANKLPLSAERTGLKERHGFVQNKKKHLGESVKLKEDVAVMREKQKFAAEKNPTPRAKVDHSLDPRNSAMRKRAEEMDHEIPKRSPKAGEPGTKVMPQKPKRDWRNEPDPYDVASLRQAGEADRARNAGAYAEANASYRKQQREMDKIQAADERAYRIKKAKEILGQKPTGSVTTSYEKTHQPWARNLDGSRTESQKKYHEREAAKYDPTKPPKPRRKRIWGN